ncbi:MAG: hypothetical protein ABH852_05590 [Methanobacteriota archaeon]
MVALIVVEKARVLVKFGVPEGGLKLGITPAGAVPTQEPLTKTVWDEPEVSLTLTAVDAEPACSTERLLGDALIEKSNTPGVVVVVVVVVEDATP